MELYCHANRAKQSKAGIGNSQSCTLLNEANPVSAIGQCSLLSLTHSTTRLLMFDLFRSTAFSAAIICNVLIP